MERKVVERKGKSKYCNVHSLNKPVHTCTHLCFWIVSDDLCTTVNRCIVVFTLNIDHTHWRGLVFNLTWTRLLGWAEREGRSGEREREREREREEKKTVTISVPVTTN